MPSGAVIAVTGGRYLAATLGGGDGLVVAGTVVVLVAGAVVNLLGGRVSGHVQMTWRPRGDEARVSDSVTAGGH